VATPKDTQETRSEKEPQKSRSDAKKRPKRAAFTDPFLKSLKPATPGEVRYEVLDAGTKHQLYPGFAIRVSSTGRKVFVLAYRRNGRRRKLTIGTYPQVSLAEARARALAVRSDADFDPAWEREVRRAAPTFAELAEMFRERHMETDAIRPATRDGYRRYLKTLITHFGDVRLSDITTETIEDFRDERTATPTGTNHALEMLSAVFSWARKKNRELRVFLPVNPCADVEHLREQPKNRVLKDDELRAVMQAANGLTQLGWRDGVWWLALHGCRPSDVYLMVDGERRGVRWEDLDLKAREWSLPMTKTEPRTVPLTPAALRALKRAEAYRKSSDVFVFVVTWDALAKKIREAAGVPFQPKDLRTTAATTMQRLRVLPDIIDRVQGRSPGGPSVRRLYQQYAYMDEQRKALEKWQRHLLSIAPEPEGER
jgi:integrase